MKNKFAVLFVLILNLSFFVIAEEKKQGTKFEIPQCQFAALIHSGDLSESSPHSLCVELDLDFDGFDNDHYESKWFQFLPSGEFILFMKSKKSVEIYKGSYAIFYNEEYNLGLFHFMFLSKYTGNKNFPWELRGGSFRYEMLHSFLFRTEGVIEGSLKYYFYKKDVIKEFNVYGNDLTRSYLLDSALETEQKSHVLTVDVERYGERYMFLKKRYSKNEEFKEFLSIYKRR